MGKSDVTVETYSGYRYGERPRTFTWEGRRYEVLSIERRWRTPRGPGFVVTAVLQTEVDPTTQEDSRPMGSGHRRPGGRWELTYNEVRDTWHVRRVTISEDMSDK